MKAIIYSAIPVLIFLSISCGAGVKSNSVSSSSKTLSLDTVINKVIKSDDEWREELTADEYYVLRESGTDRPFTGDLWDNKKKGTYTCAGCDLPLFTSETKFKSGTGWPSFYEPISDSCIIEIADYSHGWNRVEVVCGRCEGHQGHVFTDGPKPTGLRYCINTASLDFIEE